MLIVELIEAFQKHKIPHAVVRVGVKELEAAESVLKSLGFQSRIPVRAKEVAMFREEYIRERNLFAWSFVDAKDQTRQVDLLILYDLKEIKTQVIRWGGLKVVVADLPTLLKMKLAAGRPQDLLDAEKIREKIKANS